MIPHDILLILPRFHTFGWAAPNPSRHGRTGPELLLAQGCRDISEVGWKGQIRVDT